MVLQSDEGAVPLRTWCGAGRNPVAEEEGGGDRDGRVHAGEANACCIAANLRLRQPRYNQRFDQKTIAVFAIICVGLCTK